MSYVELHCHSAFSLLDGASPVEALVAQAAALDMPALALTDHDNLYGAVPFVTAAHNAGIQPIIGAELTLSDDTHLTLLVTDTRGWRNLCRLITIGQANAPKGQAALPWAALAGRTTGLVCLSGCRRGPLATALRRWDRRGAFRTARYLRDLFADSFYVELQHHLRPDDTMLAGDLYRLAGYLDLPCVVTNNVHYAQRAGQRLHDILAAIRRRATLDAVDPLLRPNDEFYLKPHWRLRPLFPFCPPALTTTLEVAARCADFQLQFGLQDLPGFVTPPGMDAAGYLAQLCEQALPWRYGTPGEQVCAQLAHELAIIAAAGLANYFLIVWDLVRFARSQGIRCQGRGSAANSLVAYLLGISPIDPLRHNLVFERFLSAERPLLPDIDLDVDALRREEVIQYLYRRYGDEHVALACTFITFQARSALNDVARALDLTPDALRGAADSAGTELVYELCRQLQGLPRHLGQHSGGMVVTGPPVAARVPVEPTAMAGRTVVQWDKDALETAGLVKIDVLGLRMLSAISTALAQIRTTSGTAPDLERLDYADPQVFALLQAADTVGVFQVESRAQTSVLPRLRPACFDDIVVAVALIRPGPIQGQMVHPYLRRRAGSEPVHYGHALLEPVLQDTLGVLLFQEQVLLVAEALAGWTRGKGEVLRRALASGAADTIAQLTADFLADAAARGIELPIAERVFNQLRGFAGYSFPRSHAAAFAVLVYQSAYLKRYHPAAFYLGLLNNQPMGFWSPAVLVGDARRHGVRVLRPDIQQSDWQSTVAGAALRLGLHFVGGLGEQGGARIMAARAERPFADLRDFCRRARLPRAVVERLILGGACDSLGLGRRALLWELGGLRYAADELELDIPLPEVDLEPLTHWEALRQEERVLGLTVTEHVLAPLRAWLNQQGVTGSRALRTRPDGTRVTVAGKLAVHQAPPTAQGHHFITLEDEDGLMDLVLRPSVAERYKDLLAQSDLLQATGMVQSVEGVVNVLIWQVKPLLE